MFLLKRSPPWVWAGWYDSFNRPIEAPIKWPWAYWGDFVDPPADINDLQEMRLRGHFFSTTGGGVGYEFYPFTPNYTFEWEMWWPVGGDAAQYFNLCVMDPAFKVGRTFANSFMVRMERSIANGHRIFIQEFNNGGMFDFGPILASAPAAAWAGRTLTIRVMIDADALVRVYVNNVFGCQAILSPANRPSNGKRGIHYFNNSLSDAWIRWVHVYDRASIIPDPDAWISQFYDDFNGRSGNQNGVNGWTQLGTDAAVLNDAWSSTAASNGNRGLIRDTGVTTGRQRVEATVGGASGPSPDVGAGLVLRVNSTGDQGLMALVYSTGVYIGRFDSSLGGSGTLTPLVVAWLTIPNGAKVAFSAIGGTAWIDVNGALAAIAGEVNAVVPETNSWAGLHVGRNSTNSNSWNDVRLMSV